MRRERVGQTEITGEGGAKLARPENDEGHLGALGGGCDEALTFFEGFEI